MSMRYTTYLAIPKNALPQKHLQYLICGYSTELPFFGTAHMFPLFPEDVPEHIERVYFSQEEIPGTELNYSAIFSKKQFDIPDVNNDSFRIFDSKEECDRVLRSLNPDDALWQAIGEVDFENYSLLAMEISVASSETIVLDQVILQDGRLVFVYHSEFSETNTDDILPQATWIAVKKTELPQGYLACFVCSYFTTEVNPDLFLPDYPQGSVYYPNYYEFQ